MVASLSNIFFFFFCSGRCSSIAGVAKLLPLCWDGMIIRRGDYTSSPYTAAWLLYLVSLSVGSFPPFLKFYPYYSYFIAPRPAVSFHRCSPDHSIEYGGCVKIINIWLKPAPAWVHYQWAGTQRRAGILSNKLACRSLFTPTLLGSELGLSYHVREWLLKSLLCQSENNRKRHISLWLGIHLSSTSWLLQS